MSALKQIGNTALRWAVFGSTSVLFGIVIAYAAWYQWTNQDDFRNKSPGDGLSSSHWNQLVTNVDNINGRLAASETSTTPSWAVVSFFGDTCPNGWSPADGTANGVKKTDGTFWTLDLRGEFIRGLDGGRGVDSWRIAWTFQSDAFQEHTHGYVTPSRTDTTHRWSGTSTWTLSSQTSYQTDSITWRTSSETRPRNVALLYCVKD